jgi:hypothetical protein
MMCACLKAISRTNVQMVREQYRVFFLDVLPGNVFTQLKLLSHDECHSNLHFQREL